jgi:hypothetical protein
MTMAKLFKIRRSRFLDGWSVFHIATGRQAFYGTKGQCQGWIERNGHDESEYV